MWANPHIDEVKDFAKNIGCDWIGAVNVVPVASYEKNECHTNVKIQTEVYGGNRVLGYYFVKGFGTYQAIEHSIWDNGKYIDITPYPDEYIIFGRKKDQEMGQPNCYLQSLAKYIDKQFVPENEVMYYVYQLVDPRTNNPFYVGKGKGHRAQHHLKNYSRDHNKYKDNKIAAIRAEGLEPKIEIVAENIVDEDLAYDIEKKLIEQHGRKGYDDGGILTNVCPDNRPPNHKGRTYEEIYGPERAKEQREKRHKLQLDAGGWFKGHTHSDETKKILSEKSSGKNNPRYGVKVSGTDVARKIGEANSKYTGKLNKKSKRYTLTSPDGVKYVVYGGELNDLCKEHNLSQSTLKKQIQEKDPWGVPKKGKTKGWKLEL